MADDERTRPTADQPLNAPRKRPLLGPALAVIGLIAVIAVIFLLITWAQQNS